MYHMERPVQDNIYLLKVAIETLKKGVKYVQRHWRHSGVFIINFEHISNLFQVFLLLILNK